MQMRSFLGITTHLIQDGKLKTQNIGIVELFEGHTAIYIGHTLIETLQSWGLEAEKVVAVVTYSGANMKKAIVDEFGAKKHLPCVAHTINLVVEKAIDKTQEISKTGVKSGGVPVLLFKVCEIVKYFKKSTKACDLLRNSQRVEGKKDGHFLKPVLDVKTRWNSSFYMIERFILLASHFSQVLLTESGKIRDIPDMVTSSELRCIEDICSLLRPIEQLTRELSTEKFVMSSKVMPIIFCTRNEIVKQDPTFSIAKNFKFKIIEELDYRFESYAFQNPLANSKAQDKLVQMMDKDTNFDDQIICSTETDVAVRESKNYDLWGLHRTLEQEHKNKRNHMTTSREELKSYLHQSVIGLNKNPLDEWESTKTVYPKLYKLAQKYLIIPGTSVRSERLFSKAGATISQTRNRLTGSKLNK
ncbi:PREDICTED: zinc finger BED domain-containing protein 4-like [Diuraphis noxia]|uniref:zinc finger BED domain-containing protein 4-like n=1 Tax=Diuraphis noxia TaxID=143948 RepID=UPI000763A505|nr:PREDICTED: zinc finger BED domain-containing protein 4-like [Diuraphis noxia]